MAPDPSIGPYQNPHPAFYLCSVPDWYVDRARYSVQDGLQPQHDEYVVLSPLVLLVHLFHLDVFELPWLTPTDPVAELVLVSVGFLFLIEPVIELWKRHVASCLPAHEQPSWVRRLATMLKLGLLAAIATAIAGASKTSSAFDSQDGIDTVTDLRKASYALSLGVSTVPSSRFVLFGYGVKC